MEDVTICDEQVLGTEEEGYLDMFKTLDAERALAAATATGIAQACLESSIRYARDRVQFGKPIASFQLVQEMLAEMATNVELARNYGHKVAWLCQQGKNINQEAAIAKLFASEMVNRVTAQALQLHGGYGYTKEYPVERYYRDARVFTIYEGTSEIQRVVISNHIFKDKRKP